LEGDDIYSRFKKKGMFLATSRTEGVSTSDIICRIVKDYDIYIRRNIKRGYTADELNVGFFREKKIRIQNQMEEFKEKVNKYQTETKDFLNKWEDRSREFITNFILKFNNNRTNMKRFLFGQKQEQKSILQRSTSSPALRSESTPNDDNDDDSQELSRLSRYRLKYLRLLKRLRQKQQQNNDSAISSHDIDNNSIFKYEDNDDSDISFDNISVSDDSQTETETENENSNDDHKAIKTNLKRKKSTPKTTTPKRGKNK
jgi:hypothetical protein